MTQGILISVAGDQQGNAIRIVTEQDSFPVHIAGIPNAIVNELFHHHTGVVSTLAANTAIGATSIVLADATGFLAGDIIQINNGHVETTFPQITVVTVDTLTLDRPLDFAYSIGNEVEVIHADLSTDAGTLTSPTSHIVKPSPGEILHIERIIISMTHTGAAADSSFGDLAALTNGVVLRAFIDGQVGSFTNWKSNRDIRLDMYDVEYTEKAGGGLHGTHARGSFNRIGVTVRLDGDKDDYMEMLVQDDLTGLSSFFVNGQGHRGR